MNPLLQMLFSHLNEMFILLNQLNRQECSTIQLHEAIRLGQAIRKVQFALYTLQKEGNSISDRLQPNLDAYKPYFDESVEEHPF